MEVTSAASNIERIDSTHDGEEEEEILKFQSLCSNCLQPADLVVQRAAIPHFEEVVLMCMLCDHCGFKTTEVKDSWSMPIPTHETKIILLVQGVEDLSRDIVLSSSAAISVPELELEQQEGGFEGMCTTVEGLLKKMLARLESATPFGSSRPLGDGAVIDPDTENRYRAFLGKFRSFCEGKYFPFKLVINDPLSASHIGSRSDTRESDIDCGLVIERTKRSKEQNERLGLDEAVTSDKEHKSQAGGQHC